MTNAVGLSTMQRTHTSTRTPHPRLREVLETIESILSENSTQAYTGEIKFSVHMSQGAPARTYLIHESREEVATRKP